jgi:predicted NBD/HSP70 family sugar kinase
MTRAEIARRINTPIATVNTHTRTLIRRGIVAERTSKASGRRGRTSALLSIKVVTDTVAAVIAVQHGSGLAQGPVRVALISMLGKFMFSAVAARSSQPVDAGLQLLHRELGSNARMRNVTCAVLSVPLPLRTIPAGEVDGDGGLRIVDTMKDVLGATPQHLVSTSLGVPTLLRNDADLGALGEYRWGAAQQVKNSIYLKVISGLGMGIICGGQLLTGDVTPGEVAHLRLPGANARCICGSVGCLWTIWNGDLGLVGMLGATGIKFSHFADVERAAAAGDPGLLSSLYQIGFTLGQALGGSFFVFRPALLVLEGNLGSAFEALSKGLHAALAAAEPTWVPNKLRIVRGELGEDAELLGAVSVAQDYLLSGPPPLH